MFTWGDIVIISDAAPAEWRPGAIAWVVGVFECSETHPVGDFPPGMVYLVEFEDGSATEVTEQVLRYADPRDPRLVQPDA